VAQGYPRGDVTYVQDNYNRIREAERRAAATQEAISQGQAIERARAAERAAARSEVEARAEAAAQLGAYNQAQTRAWNAEFGGNLLRTNLAPLWNGLPATPRLAIPPPVWNTQPVTAPRAVIQVPVQEGKECAICVERKPVGSFPKVTANCTHEASACTDSIRNWLGTPATLNGMNWNRISCMTAGCNEILQYEDMRRNAAADVFQR
jgi:hypothetical protein